MHILKKRCLGVVYLRLYISKISLWRPRAPYGELLRSTHLRLIYKKLVTGVHARTRNKWLEKRKKRMKLGPVRGHWRLYFWVCPKYIMQLRKNKNTPLKSSRHRARSCTSCLVGCNYTTRWIGRQMNNVYSYRVQLGHLWELFAKPPILLLEQLAGGGNKRSVQAPPSTRPWKHIEDTLLSSTIS